MVSSEAVPLAKTGGLADVLGALPSALRAHGDDVAVVIPRYQGIDLRGARRVWDPLTIYLGRARYNTSVYLVPGDVPRYVIDCPPLFDRRGLYSEAGIDFPDNHIRFAVFARAAVGVARYLFRTEIFHCHDWQAGLVAPYLQTVFASDPTFLASKTLFTIHNLGYQGLFPSGALADAALDPALYRSGRLEFHGNVSYIKGGIEFADALNTVSPTYAREIQTPEYGFGLDGALRARAGVLTGILNGVDYREWNPETDAFLPARYSATDLAGKRLCKEQLLAEFGLPASAMDAPLLGLVSRFAGQKVELIDQIAAELLSAGVYLVALGSGEPRFEDFFRWLGRSRPDRIAVRIGYDNGLAHRIEAGADIFLMPSRYEPCGLNQMYSLRYGTVPVVRATGGLNDTIEDGVTGFKFEEYSGGALLAAIRRAIEAFAGAAAWKAMMVQGMGKDFSWPRSAAAYSALYQRLLGRA
jgi:starch synthase